MEAERMEQANEAFESVVIEDLREGREVGDDGEYIYPLFVSPVTRVTTYPQRDEITLTLRIEGDSDILMWFEKILGIQTLCVHLERQIAREIAVMLHVGWAEVGVKIMEAAGD